MSGIRSNQAYLVQAKQTGKAVAPTKWQDKLFFSGGSIAPTHQSDQLAETDSNRQAGDLFTTQTAAEGSPEVYVRTGSVHHALEYALGAATHEGTTNFTHKISAAAALPYVTFGRGIGNTLFEQFNDGKVSELTISAGTAQPLTAAYTILARSSVRQATEWATELAPPAASTEAPLNFNNATVTLAGAGTSLVSSFELTVSNNVSLQQTDDSIPFDVIEGQLVVTLGFDLIFENMEQYNLFNYETTSGTTQGPGTPTTTAKFEFIQGTNNQVIFEFPKIAYQEFPVDPDPGGDPIVVSVRAQAQRHAEGFVKATVKNQTEK